MGNPVQPYTPVPGPYGRHGMKRLRLLGTRVSFGEEAVIHPVD